MHSHKYSYARIHKVTHMNTQKHSHAHSWVESLLKACLLHSHHEPQRQDAISLVHCGVPSIQHNAQKKDWVSSLLQWEEQGCPTLPSLQRGLGKLDTLKKNGTSSLLFTSSLLSPSVLPSSSPLLPSFLHPLLTPIFLILSSFSASAPCHLLLPALCTFQS